MSQPAVDVRQLAERLVGTVPRFDVTGRRVAVALYRELAKGEPVSLTCLAARLQLPQETVRNTLAAGSVFYDSHGAVIGFGGLTVTEMPPHGFRVDGRTLYTWCAWDSLFIPAILGKTADVSSRDPVNGVPISLRVAPDGVREVHPPVAVVSFLVRERAFDRDVITNFCHFVHFFSAEETGRAWTAGHPGTFLLSIADAFWLGQLTNAHNFGDTFDPAAGSWDRTENPC